MTEPRITPIEELPEVAAAVEDETPVPQLAEQGGPGELAPEFVEPEEQIAATD